MANNMNTKIEDNTTQNTAAHFAVGRRKRAIARVRVYVGEGNSTINGKSTADYSQTINQKKQLAFPWITSGLAGKYYFTAKVIGGGINSQIGAVTHGVSRCIAQMSEALHSTMAQNSLLTRDPREKERKKIYHVRARKMPQFSKR